jgi:hypothetical protein
MMLLPIAAAAAAAYWFTHRTPGGGFTIKPDGSAASSAAATIARIAGPALAKTGLPVQLAIAQAMVETGWGRAVPGHNWFGIKGTGPAGTVKAPTKEEFSPGKVSRQVSGFRRYNSAEQSVKDWGRFVAEQVRYRPAVKMSPGGALLWLWAMGYATATRYPQTVAAVSAGVARRLNNPKLQITLTPAQLALAKKLGTIPAGKSRRNAAVALYRSGAFPT